jgi:hypothetical protein
MGRGISELISWKKRRAADRRPGTKPYLRPEICSKLQLLSTARSLKVFFNQFIYGLALPAMNHQHNQKELGLWLRFIKTRLPVL